MVSEKQHKESAPPVSTEIHTEKTSYFLAEVCPNYSGNYFHHINYLLMLIGCIVLFMTYIYQNNISVY